MLQMRDIGTDWVNRNEQKDDYKQKKKVLIQVRFAFRPGFNPHCPHTFSCAWNR